LATFAVVVTGTFVPIADDAALTYYFIWAGGDVVGLLAAASALIVGIACVGALRAARQLGSAQEREAARGVWLAPLTLAALPALGLLPAIPGVGERGAVVAFFFYDLKWWWLGTALVLTFWRLHSILGSPLRSSAARVAGWSPAARLLAGDSCLAVTLIVWVTVTSPHVRMTSDLFGDEPRYVRYCETWYQGRGCDASANTSFSASSLDASPHLLRNLGLVAQTAVEEAPRLVRDLAQFAAHPLTFRWNRSPGGVNGFVTGKDGTGMYALHQPGWSLMLLPGYAIDRYLLGTGQGHQDEFPAELAMTTTTTLVLYALCGIVLFRLLRVVLANEGAAWLSAVFAMATFPTSAFAFQLYPEIAAMLIVVASALIVAKGLVREPVVAPRSRLRTFAVGMLMATLCWLHPRFLLLSAVLAGFGVWAVGRERRLFLAAGWTSVLFVLGAYNFHIAGSWMPNALYAASSDVRQLVLANIPDNLIAYFFHGSFGVAPNALWLLALIPGFALLLRGEPASALFVASVGLALAIPAAGHALNPAGGTPGRFVVAVVPLMIWPVAVLVRRCWSSAYFRVVTAIAMVLSLDAALSYNRTFVKDGLGILVDTMASGWRPDLAFPRIREYFRSTSDPEFALLVGFLLAIGAATYWVLRRDRHTPEATESASSFGARVSLPTICGVVAALIATTTGVAAGLDQWTYRRYMLPDADARNGLARAAVHLDVCRLCFSSERRHLSWRALPNPARDPIVNITSDGTSAAIQIDVGSSGAALGFGKVRASFGDGSTAPTAGFVGPLHIAHEYPAAGRYDVVVQVAVASGTRTFQQALTIPDLVHRTP
jgi:hypothetical protein